MTPALALVVLAATVVIGITCTWIALRRRAERASERAARLKEIAVRIDAAVSSIGDVVVPERVEERAAQAPAQTTHDVDEGLPGRLALLAAVDAGVQDARAGGRRLSAAIVRSADSQPRALAAEAHAVAEVPVYAVGPRAVALVLPGLGRADALGVLARIEARCPSSGRAVELEADEDAVELVTRLLAQTSAAGARDGGQAPDGARPASQGQAPGGARPASQGQAPGGARPVA